MKFKMVNSTLQKERKDKHSDKVFEKGLHHTFYIKISNIHIFSIVFLHKCYIEILLECYNIVFRLKYFQKFMK